MLGLCFGLCVLVNDIFGMEFGIEVVLCMVDVDGFWIDVVGDDGKLFGVLEIGWVDGVWVVDLEGFYVELFDLVGNVIGYGCVD